MTREIKFRAWDADGKKMFYYEPLLPLEVTDEYWVGELMQFTGLTDKNGKEIYEGDLVRQHDNDDLIYEVKFGIYNNEADLEDNISGNGWYLENLNLSYRWMLGHLDDGKNLEVVGHIKEHPELLKKGLRLQS